MRVQRAVGLALLAALAPGQQRRPLAGVVTDDAGAPIAAARVWLCGETAPTSGAGTDVVLATTDANGRFRADVLECVEYDAWAVGPERDDGTWLASAAMHGVVPGPRVELRTAPLRARTLRLSGLGAWADLAPFQARLWLVGSGHAATVPLDAGGSAAVPRQWPAGDALVVVHDRAGQPLVLANVPAATWTAAVPAPQPFAIEVRDESGGPVAGAVVERAFCASARLEPLGHRLRYLRAVLGSTDAGGRVRVRVAAHGGDPATGLERIELRVRAAGCAGAAATSFRGGLFSAAGAEQSVDGVRQLRFVLRPAHELTAEVLLAPGRPLAGCALHVGMQHVLHGDGIGIHVHHERDVRTGADGRCRLEELAADASCTGVTLGATALAALVGAQRHERAFPPGQPFVAATLVAEPPQLRVDLSQLGRVALQVVDERDGPAGGALVMLQSEAGQATYLDADDPRFRLDPAGRATVLLARGPWFVLATDGVRGVAQSIVVGEGEESLRLQIRPWPFLPGSVRDAAGRPVAGATFESRSYGPGSTRLDYLHVLLLQRWLPRVRSDAAGRFELPFLPDTNVEYTVRMTAGGSSSDEFVLGDPGAPLEVRLR